MKKYKVFDIFDGTVRETLGYADNMREIRKIANKRIEETDGECVIAYITLDTTINKYRLSTMEIL